MSGYEKFMSSILRAGSRSVEPEEAPVEEAQEIMEEPEVFEEEPEESEEEPEEFVEEPKLEEPKIEAMPETVWPPLINQFNFFGATQQPGESYTQFAIRLREMAATCNLPNLEESLWHRFYLGMLPGPERAMLCSVKLCEPMTLANAVSFVEGLRYTRGVAKEWAPPPVSLSTPMNVEEGPHCPCGWTDIPGLRYTAYRYRLPQHKGYIRSRNGYRLLLFGNTKTWYGRINYKK